MDGRWLKHTYDSDELASGSEDEKRLFKTEKATEREMLKQKWHPTKEKTVYHTAVPHPSRAATINSGIGTGEQGSGPSSQSVGQWNQNTMGNIGPCFWCAAWGHLQKNYPKVAKYPFVWIDGNSGMVNAGISNGSVELQGGRDKNAVLWWKTNQEWFPVRAKIVHQLLCVPTTSVPCEDFNNFSCGGWENSKPYA